MLPDHLPVQEFQLAAVNLSILPLPFTEGVQSIFVTVLFLEHSPLPLLSRKLLSAASFWEYFLNLLAYDLTVPGGCR